MLIALLAMYVWAGATTAMAMVQFREIRKQVNDLMPDEKKLENGALPDPELATIIAMIAIWPIMLPLWIAARTRHAA
jgi:hypothetical protein